MSDAAETFEPHRRYLAGIAYRMLGSIAEAEDVVQDAFLRWDASERATVDEPRAYLTRVVSRLCLDRMKSAHARREEYPGTWLPEPVVAGRTDDIAALAGDLSVALLVTLESLSPLERAAFLLHDVFDLEFGEIAGVLDRTEQACRQLANRAREHVRAGRPRYTATPETSARLAGAFRMAAVQGDLAALTSLLAEDAVLYSDGGGKRRAALNPIYGRDKILRFLVGISGKFGLPDLSQLEPATINDLPGFVLHTPEGPETIALGCNGDAIVALYLVRNPDKLRHLA